MPRRYCAKNVPTGTPARRSGGRRAEPHVAAGMPWSGRFEQRRASTANDDPGEGLRCVKRLTGAAAPVNRATVQDATPRSLFQPNRPQPGPTLTRPTELLTRSNFRRCRRGAVVQGPFRESRAIPQHKGGVDGQSHEVVRDPRAISASVSCRCPLAAPLSKVQARVLSTSQRCRDRSKCLRVRHGGASAGPNGGHLLGHKEP